MVAASYAYNVFINCPFDDPWPLFEALVFAVHDCGYIARCALEVDDASEVRIEKIAKIIRDCKFGIHDICRTEPDPLTGLPRFNMPLELGFFLGAKRFGRAEQKQKTCLILDVEKYRFQKFISDIAGQDISAHAADVAKAIKVVRDWLSNATPLSITIPGASLIVSRYELFRNDLPTMCEKLHLNVSELTFNNYVVQVEEWLKLNAQVAAG
jgi:hypothetical protein